MGRPLGAARGRPRALLSGSCNARPAVPPRPGRRAARRTGSSWGSARPRRRRGGRGRGWHRRRPCARRGGRPRAPRARGSTRHSTGWPGPPGAPRPLAAAPARPGAGGACLGGAGAPAGADAWDKRRCQSNVSSGAAQLCRSMDCRTLCPARHARRGRHALAWPAGVAPALRIRQPRRHVCPGYLRMAALRRVGTPRNARAGPRAPCNSRCCALSGGAAPRTTRRSASSSRRSRSAGYPGTPSTAMMPRPSGPNACVAAEPVPIHVHRAGWMCPTYACLRCHHVPHRERAPALCPGTSRLGKSHPGRCSAR